MVLNDALAFKELKTKIEDIYMFGNHHNYQVIYLGHYTKDVFPVVREVMNNNHQSG